jgi:hypothetical protein
VARSGSLLLAGFFAAAMPSIAQLKIGPVTVGAGMRTSFAYTRPDAGDSTDKFALDSIRLYVSGSVTEDNKIKFMFNTDYNSNNNHIGVLDAVGRFELHPMFNVWAGRVLPPSDRANLAGPYFNSHWGVYTDGIQNGHPSVFQGRDNGFVYWGDFGKKVKISAGAFDGQSADGRPNVISAYRLQFDFWDHEDGYYLNSTYYGAKKLLSLGGATQVQGGNTATTVDSCSKEISRVTVSSPSKASTPTTTGWAGTTPNIRRARVHTDLPPTFSRRQWVRERFSFWRNMPRPILPAVRCRATTRKPRKGTSTT